MVITSFHDLDRKAKRLYKSHNPLSMEVAYKISKQKICGLDTVHLVGATCIRKGTIINNVVGSRRINIFGQPFTAAIKCTGADITKSNAIGLTSVSLKAKNSLAPTDNTMIHINSCVSLGSNGSKFSGATIFQLFTDASRLSSWCIGGQFSLRSEWKTILSVTYFSPKINMATRAYFHIVDEGITSSISYKLTDKWKSGLSVTMVENNAPLIGFGVNYKLNENFCFNGKVNDLGRTAFGFRYCPGPNFSFSISMAP